MKRNGKGGRKWDSGVVMDHGAAGEERAKGGGGKRRVVMVEEKPGEGVVAERRGDGRR